MDALMLARAQFGANITFHILFPTITIALGWILLFFKLRYSATKDMKWMEAYRTACIRWPRYWWYLAPPCRPFESLCSIVGCIRPPGLK